MKKVQLLAAFVFLSSFLFGQKYDQFQAGFTIKEKNAATNNSSLIIGDVTYTKSTKLVIYQLKFPKQQRWEFRDTMLYKYQNDTLIEEKVIGFFSQENIFKSLLNNESTDYGLTEAQFTIEDINEVGDYVEVNWTPPAQLNDRMTSVQTSSKDNLLYSVKMFDEKGSLAMESYNDDYQLVNNISVPLKITSRIQTEFGDVMKVITFRNPQIQ